VYDEEDNYLGELTNVIETGANDVYEVKFEDGRDVLFPAIKQCILNVDMDNRTMKVHIMKGLLD
jgi:16S rRNA processing protein RimM